MNADYEMSFIRIVLLLFVDFFYLLIAFILLKYPWKDSERFPKLLAHRQEKFFNGALLLFTIGLLFVPLSLKAKTVKANHETPTTAIFRVAVPYFDESLERNMGAARWDRRLLCEVAEVQAASESEAIGNVLKSFEDSQRGVQIINTKGAAVSKVLVIKDKITVQRK